MFLFPGRTTNNAHLFIRSFFYSIVAQAAQSKHNNFRTHICIYIYIYIQVHTYQSSRIYFRERPSAEKERKTRSSTNNLQRKEQRGRRERERVYRKKRERCELVREPSIPEFVVLRISSLTGSAFFGPLHIHTRPTLTSPFNPRGERLLFLLVVENAAISFLFTSLLSLALYSRHIAHHAFHVKWRAQAEI